eukprot:8172962-Alexandrium_andersonii.AAC.1
MRDCVSSCALHSRITNAFRSPSRNMLLNLLPLDLPGPSSPTSSSASPPPMSPCRRAPITKC